jgi:hypothetical protein
MRKSIKNGTNKFGIVFEYSTILKINIHQLKFKTMAKITQEEIKNLNGKEYEIEQTTWNGNGWDNESGYFTEKGVVRFAGTPMELFESYKEIDEDILEACIECIVDVDDDKM